MQIVLLKRAGFTLAEIGVLLEHDAQTAADVLADRIAVLEQEVTVKTQALNALRFAARRAGLTAVLSVEQLLESINMSSKLDMRFTEAQRKEFRQRAEKIGKCFTAEEQEAFRKRAEILGEDRIAQVEHEWPELIVQVRAAMDASIPQIGRAHV